MIRTKNCDSTRQGLYGRRSFIDVTKGGLKSTEGKWTALRLHDLLSSVGACERLWKRKWNLEFFSDSRTRSRTTPPAAPLPPPPAKPQSTAAGPRAHAERLSLQ